MELYVCADCHSEADPNDYRDLENCRSIEEFGACLDCRADVIYCPDCDKYYDDVQDYNSFKKDGKCSECADEYSELPNTDDKDFWDSYDPD